MNSSQAPFQFVEDYYSADLAERNSPESLWFLSWLREVRGESVLSLGCGPNLFDDAFFFHNIPRELIGIDINKNNIEFLKKSKHPELIKCKKTLFEKNTKIELLVDDIQNDRKEFHGRFDTVYAMGVLGMLKKDDLKKILSIINCYLKRGGVLVDIDWTECQLSQEKYKERESFNWYDKNGPSISEIGLLMKDVGFEVRKHKIYSVPNPQEYGWGKIYGYLASK